MYDYSKNNDVQSQNEEYRITHSRMDAQIKYLTKKIQELAKKVG
jgi:hypothetical protein